VGYDPGGRWSKSDGELTYDSDDIIDADPEDETALSDTATE
jgi:hypothetical protein